jgi:aminoglycoside 6'-N-acetyltransferase
MSARFGSSVTLRPASRADWPALQRWLARPDIETWWGPRAATEAAVTMALTDSQAICRIIVADGEDVGYAHAIDATVWGAALPDDLEPGTWEIELFVASEQHRGLGVGQVALKALIDEVFGTTMAMAVCVFVPVANERAVRAYEKAGLTWKSIWNTPAQGHAWFMVKERG